MTDEQKLLPPSMQAPRIKDWSNNKLAREYAFADACRDDGKAEMDWYNKLNTEIERRIAERG